LIVGQILGGSLAGAVIGSHDGIAGFHDAYLWFAGVAIAAVLVTFALHSKDRERAEART
jgi:hypothetical protein